MKEGTYKVKTTNYTFILDILHYDTTYSIKYGDALNNRNGPCIELTYDIEDDYIKLDSLMYDIRCSHKEELKKGDGTREMIKSIMKLCIQMFPDVKRIVFNDVSSIMCNNKNLFLCYYYLLLHGETWYEKYFNAKPLKQKLSRKLKLFKEFLKDKPKNDVFTFYRSGNYETWHDYFKTKPCEFFIDHKNEIEKISQIKLVYSDWYISSKYISEYDVDILSVKKYKQQAGGFNNMSKNQLFTFEDL